MIYDKTTSGYETWGLNFSRFYRSFHRNQGFVKSKKILCTFTVFDSNFKCVALTRGWRGSGRAPHHQESGNHPPSRVVKRAFWVGGGCLTMALPSSPGWCYIHASPLPGPDYGTNMGATQIERTIICALHLISPK
jgi:hypothetical protein